MCVTGCRSSAHRRAATRRRRATPSGAARRSADCRAASSSGSGSRQRLGAHRQLRGRRARHRHPRRRGRSSIPVGQEIDVRLQKELTSDTAQVEDRFEATTAVDLYRGNEVLIPAGSMMRGVVSSVNRASRTDRKGSMTVAFDQVTVNGRAYPMRGTVTQALESEGIKGEIGRIGAGSAVGAIIGGIIGGVQGCAAWRPDRRRRHDCGHGRQGRAPAGRDAPARADGHAAEYSIASSAGSGFGARGR